MVYVCVNKTEILIFCHTQRIFLPAPLPYKSSNGRNWASAIRNCLNNTYRVSGLNHSALAASGERSVTSYDFQRIISVLWRHELSLKADKIIYSSIGPQIRKKMDRIGDSRVKSVTLKY